MQTGADRGRPHAADRSLHRSIRGRDDHDGDRLSNQEDSWTTAGKTEEEEVKWSHGEGEFPMQKAELYYENWPLCFNNYKIYTIKLIANY